jgi:hypothetical protein
VLNGLKIIGVLRQKPWNEASRKVVGVMFTVEIARVFVRYFERDTDRRNR